MHPIPYDLSRTELCIALHDLSDAIRSEETSRDHLLVAAHRVWVSAQLAELDTDDALLVHQLVHDVAKAMEVPWDLDRAALARTVSLAAEFL